MQTAIKVNCISPPLYYDKCLATWPKLRSNLLIWLLTVSKLKTLLSASIRNKHKSHTYVISTQLLSLQLQDILKRQQLMNKQFLTMKNFLRTVISLLSLENQTKTLNHTLLKKTLTLCKFLFCKSWQIWKYVKELMYLCQVRYV